MPQFLINARDKAGALDVRMANRPAHLDWLKSHNDRILMVGPVFADDGETFVGSTVVVEVDTLDDAKAWAAEDPYAKAGLFETVEIRLFRWVLGSGRPE